MPHHGKAALPDKQSRLLRPRNRSMLAPVAPQKMALSDACLQAKPSLKQNAAQLRPQSLYDDFSLSVQERQDLIAIRKKRNAVRSPDSGFSTPLSWSLFNRNDCAEYQEENFNYLQDREFDTLPLVNDFIKGVAEHEITTRMRYILINWLVSVHDSYKLSAESLYLTVALMDRYIHRTKEPLARDRYQLLGITSMFVATKFEEMYPPDIRDFVSISDGAFTKKELRNFEKTLLTTLDFNLGIPLPITFLRRYTSAIEADCNMHNMAKYFLELTLTEYELAHLPGNLRSAIAVCLARALCKQCEDTERCWTPELVYLSSYSYEDMNAGLRVLAKAVYRQNSPSRYRAIHNKYQMHQSLCFVADLPILRSRLLETIAQLEFDEDGAVIE